MKANILCTLGLALILGACKPPQESSTLASSSSQTYFAIVKDCSGVMSNKWLDAAGKNPVKGELNFTVETLPKSKKISQLSVRQVIPERRVAGTNEILASSSFDIKNLSIASLNVSRSRGGSVTFIKAAPNQTAQMTSGGQTSPLEVVSLELRNNVGVDQVTLKLNLINKNTAQPFSSDITFEGCSPQNLSLLVENSK